jgi:hypothetical protein
VQLTRLFRPLAFCLASTLALAGQVSGVSPSATSWAAEATRPRAFEPRIAHGTLDFSHPAVLQPGTSCSAVRSAPRRRRIHCRAGTGTGEPLSATECAARPELLAPTGRSLFFQHGGEIPLVKIEIAPEFVFGHRSDLAVLHLAGPVEGVAPLALHSGAAPAAGTTGTLVGFGRAGGSTDDRGLKRTGSVTLSTCSAVPAANNLCWAFSDPLPAAGLSSNSCDGDAGAPLLLDVGGAIVVGGIVSGGLAPSCLPPDESWASDVAVDGAWIAAQAGSDLGATSCGGLAPAGTVGAVTAGSSGDLSGGTAEARSSVVVPVGTARLRVAVNGDEVGRTAASTDFDLYLQPGTLPTPSSYACRSATVSAPPYFDSPFIMGPLIPIMAIPSATV